ncbi:MAG: MATE family efflux transporter [Prevotella sp.]|uniref:MATE family efflux transporter n=1 Tax=Prevotella sp. P5-92 TaxID=2024222 RepID=UPI0020B15F08|nr:MATE family efflux transporter [Prevotella sp. P5-92]MCI7399906.1 MATE family efflux transporter [Prevotella sp.]MDY4653491.1 MATE family efflux transporter [Prevotella sp.]
MDNVSVKKNLYKLTMPIFIDIALVMLLGAVDTVMLSRYSDDAVAAVGLDNQLISFVFLVYQFVSMGAAILCAQYFGAGYRTRFMQIVGIAVVVNTLLGLTVSCALWLWAEPILAAFGLREALMADGVNYLRIAGSLSFFQAISLTFSAVLRSTGKTIKPMTSTVVVNILNILGNYALIFGHWGLPAMGVEGAAWATACSRIASMVILACFMNGVWRTAEKRGGATSTPRGIVLHTLRASYFVITLPFKIVFRSASAARSVWSSYRRYFSPFPWQEMKNLFHIGIPAMSEEMSYSLSQIVITFFINQISTEALTTKVYCTTTITFVILFSVSIVQGGDIIVGHYIGQLRNRAAYILGNYVYRVATILTLIVAAILAVGGHTLLTFLTDNEYIIATGTWIFCIDFFLSYGRVKNIFACGTLRATGDAIYPVCVGVICQWTVAVGVAWLLGIPCGFGLLGIWFAFCLDENLRGIILMRRWHSLKWQGKAFV